MAEQSASSSLFHLSSRSRWFAIQKWTLYSTKNIEKRKKINLLWIQQMSLQESVCLLLRSSRSSDRALVRRFSQASLFLPHSDFRFARSRRWRFRFLASAEEKEGLGRLCHSLSGYTCKMFKPRDLYEYCSSYYKQ